MYVPNPRPAAQEVDSASAELSGAGAREKKLESARFYEAVHFVEQRRHLLDLVDDYRPVFAAGLLDVSSIAGKAGECIGVEQIKNVCVGNRFAYERRLAALARSEKKAGLVLKYAGNVEFSLNIHQISSCLTFKRAYSIIYDGQKSMANRQLCRQICSKVANSVGGLLTIFGYLFMCSHVFALRSFKNQLKKTG